VGASLNRVLSGHADETEAGVRNMVGVKELYDKLLQLEEDLDLFNQAMSGVLFWERVRAGIFFRITQSTISGQPSSTIRYSALKKIEFYLSSIIDLSRNPLLSRTKDVLFVGNERRLLRDDGRWWDIYTDPVIDYLDASYVSIEHDYLLNHRAPAKTANLRRLDFLYFLANLKRALGLARVSLTTEEKQLAHQISVEVSKRFGVDIDIGKAVQLTLEKRKANLGLYTCMLKRIRPKVVVIVVSYGKEDLIEACKSLRIPTVELQHGVISPYHPGYAFQGDLRRKSTFPDYLLTWGDYWQKCTEYPLDADHIVSVGYPFIEEMKRKQIDVTKKQQILIISQERIGTLISRFAVKLSEIEGLDYKIVYKLHPRECDSWRETYPWLADANLEVIDTTDAILHKLFAESMIQLGVFSTAIYEGLSYGLDTYLIDAPGVEYFTSLLKTGQVRKVSSSEELLNFINKQEASLPFDSEYFFRSNAIENIIRFLHDLVS